MNNDSYLWLLPFVCFGFGYYFVFSLSYRDSFELPSVVGCSLQAALKELSAHKLTAVIKAEKEDPHLVEGTIITQSPQPGQKVKPQQSIFLVVAKNPPPMMAPSYRGLMHGDIQANAKKVGIRLKLVYLESHYPKNTCVAQIPAPGVPLHEKVMYLYLSSGSTPLRIMPDFRGCSVEEVRDFLAIHNVELKFFSQEQASDHDSVQDQRPLPGCVINLLKNPIFYVSAAIRSPRSVSYYSDDVYAYKGGKEAPYRRKSNLPQEQTE